MPPWGPTTTSEEVAQALAPEIHGKTILITGATLGGLGAQAALALSHHAPKLLILAGRSLSKSQATADAIRAAAPSVPIRLLELDLASQAQIRSAAAEVNAYAEPIDVLINNAGIMAAPYARTVDGLEAQFATNHVGPFLFTNLVMGRVLAAGRGARVVNVTSSGHAMEGIRWEDYGFEDGKTFDKWKAYAQGKTANCLFTVALVEKLGAKGLLSFVLHPGGIRTNIMQQLTEDEMKAMGWYDEGGNELENPMFTWKNISQGAATHIVAGFDPSIADQNGSYLQDCHVDNEACAPHAKDKAQALKLWELSEQLVGEKFQY